MVYRYRKTAPEEKTQIMALLRSQGTVTGNPFQYSRQLDLLYWLEAENFRLTQLSVQPASGKEHLFREFGLFGDGWSGVMTFRVQTSRLREPDDGGWTTQIDACEMTGKSDSIPDSLTDAVCRAVSWYVLSRSSCSGQFLEWDEMENLAAVQKEMLKKQAFWRSQGIVLAEDYHFTVTNDAERMKLWKCITAYGWDDFDYQNARLCIALTDRNRSFLLTMSHYLSDIVKRCGEPNDYGYAILTPDTAGTITVWFTDPAEIREKRGVIPFPDETILRMARFYDHYYYVWESTYRKQFGGLDEASARKKAEKSLDEISKT